MKNNVIADQIVAKITALLRRNHKKAAMETALDLSRQHGWAAAVYMAAADEEVAYAAYSSSWKEVEKTRKEFRNEEFREELKKDALRQRCRLDKEAAGPLPSGVNWRHTVIALRASFEDAAKCRRVLIAALDGVKAIKAFVNGGCRTLVTKTKKETKDVSFNLQRFAVSAEAMEHQLQRKRDYAKQALRNKLDRRQIKLQSFSIGMTDIMPKVITFGMN